MCSISSHKKKGGGPPLASTHNAHLTALLPSPGTEPRAPAPPLTALAIRATVPLMLMRVRTVGLLPLALPSRLLLVRSWCHAIPVSFPVSTLGLHVPDAAFLWPGACPAAGVGVDVGDDGGSGARGSGGV